MEDLVTQRTLLVRIRDPHDWAAWQRFVDLYGPLVYRFVRQRGLQDADAADLTQEVFQNVARAVRRLDYDPRQGTFRGWLYTVTRNKLYDFLEKGRTQPVGSGDTDGQRRLEAEPCPDDGEEAIWEHEHERQLFHWAANEVRGFFSEQTWQAFWRTGVEGRSAQEVADELKMSVGAVYVAKSRALARLMKKVQEAQAGEIVLPGDPDAAASSCPPPERLRQLLDDRLAPDEQADLTAHLGTCSRCQHELEALATHGGPRDAATLLLTTPPPVEGNLARVLDELRSAPGQAVARRPGAREEWVLSFLGPASAPGSLGRLGEYDVLEVLGQGGMGIVLKAFDPSLRRQVAIKVLAPYLASDPQARQRFAREARSAAAVLHENVVIIHAVSEAAGLPFLVMELVAGGSLQDHLDRDGALSIVAVVRVGAQVAAGLAAAHARGVVHRDIKPANLLLAWAGHASPTLADCKVKISDFGLARAADETSLTQSGVVAGTPMYMAPEQALGEVVGPKADLFSLGSTLYALCAGRPPFATGAPMAVLRQVCDAAPPPLRALKPAVPAWLVEVIASLQAKRPEQRFPSAAELAELLRQHLAHLEEPERVPSPPDTSRRLRRLRRQPRRRRLLAGIALVALIALGLALIVQRWPSRAARGGEQAPRLEFGGKDGPLWSLAFAPSGTALATGADDGTVRLWSPEDGSEIAELKGHKFPVFALAFNPAGDTLATASSGGAIRLWRTATHAPLARFSHAGTRCLAFSLDGKVLATGSTRSQVELLNATDGKVIQAFPQRFTVLAVAYAPDGRTLVSADSRGNLKVWARGEGTGRDRQLWRERTGFSAHNGSAYALAFHPNGQVLASAGADQVIKLWDTVTWEERGALRGHSNGVLKVAFCPPRDALPGGEVLASGGRDGAVKLWDFAKREEIVTLSGHNGAVWSVAFSPDGRSLASAGEDKMVRVWDVGQYTGAGP